MSTSQSVIQFQGQQRLHIGLTVRDLERSIAFYRTLLGCEPSKQRPGYARFEAADPSVNLSLTHRASAPATGHGMHFGVQVKSTAAVEAAADRLRAIGLDPVAENSVACCFAVQDKVWVTDPDGHEWEVFVVLDDDGAAATTTACCSDECC